MFFENFFKNFLEEREEGTIFILPHLTRFVKSFLEFFVNFLTNWLDGRNAVQKLPGERETLARESIRKKQPKGFQLFLFEIFRNSRDYVNSGLTSVFDPARIRRRKKVLKNPSIRFAGTEGGGYMGENYFRMRIFLCVHISHTKSNFHFGIRGLKIPSFLP